MSRPRPRRFNGTGWKPGARSHHNWVGFRRPEVSAAPQPALDVAAAVASGALPFISDRAKPDRDTVLLILGSRFAREQQGLRAQDVGAVLTHFYIRFDAKALARDLWHLYEAGTISGRRISKGVRRYFYEPPKEVPAK